ncbi:MAG TPA: hypothetical protein VL572_09180 [Pyrinomonadaceae bacterium]|nr:hypothetical protein [Pyrinomonadaceae bacterium]
MKLFEGKTKSERNKTIAAMILLGACLIVLFYAFGRGMFGGGTTKANVKATPTPRKQASSKPESSTDQLKMPSPEDQIFQGETIPIVYQPGRFSADPPGRNIFAFYEPGKPTPYVPTPAPIKTASPTPIPTPLPINLAVVNPQSVYAGSNGFRMEIAGDKFTPDTKIYMDQQELPSTFISETRMTADVPNVLIRNDGQRRIMAQTADGTKYSNQITFDIQPAPKPQFTYIGMIARKRSNNDTAYFQEPGKQMPTSARLNDVVGGRFRLVSISEAESIVEDVSLGFKHRITIRPASAASGATGPQPGGRPFPGRTQPGFPASGAPMPSNPTRVPGIPDNIPRYSAPGSNSNRNVNNNKPDPDDDNDDGL